MANHSWTRFSYAVVLLFIVSFLWAGLQNTLFHEALVLGEFPLFSSNGPEKGFKGHPDINDPLFLRTIKADELTLDRRRLIFVGDIHGMKTSLDKLLSKVSYNSSRDILLHLGDIIAKGPDSLRVLSYFSKANVTGVRGNHEQTVIEWRAWIEWVEGHHGGKTWLKNLEHKYPHGFHSKKRTPKLKWEIPKGLEFTGDHYKLARHITGFEYNYLKSLPLVIHLPSLHTFAVHAGILPFDPRYPPDASRQPLAHIPTVPSLSSDEIRFRQEQSLLIDIKQNTDPWVLLNMRSVLHNGVISRNAHEGTPWPELWNKIMKRCHGYHHEYHHRPADRMKMKREDETGPASLHLACLPINIVFGHSASRGLDVKGWSFGLDDGCVKGRHLAALLVSDLTSFVPFVDAKIREIPFGERAVAQLVSVHCPKHH